MKTERIRLEKVSTDNKWEQTLSFLKHCTFSCWSGGLNSSSGDFSWADTCPWPARLPQRCLLCLRDWRDLPCRWKPVHTHNGKPGHSADIHAPGVWRHRSVHHPHPDTLGTVTAWFHSTAYQDPPERCPWHSAQHCSAEPGQFWSKPQVSPAGHVELLSQHLFTQEKHVYLSCCEKNTTNLLFIPHPGLQLTIYCVLWPAPSTLR